MVASRRSDVVGIGRLSFTIHRPSPNFPSAVRGWLFAND
jgi:hypothetical protein